MSMDFTAYRYDPARRAFLFVEDAPTINVANTTGYALLCALGLPTDESCGSIPPQDIPGVRRRVLQLLNQDAALSAFTVPVKESSAVAEISIVSGSTVTVARPSQARIVDFGVPLERLQARLASLDEILRYCQAHDLEFGWT